MTFYYVSTIGNDSTGDGSISKPYATINIAITRAVNGDVIEVAAGTYTGNFDVNKVVTINGANAGQPGISNVRAPETILLNSKSNILANAILDGLKFKHTDNISDALILQSGPTITNCVFERIATVTGQTARAISTSSGAGNYNIINNLFTGSITGGLFSGHVTWNSALFLTNVSGRAGIIDYNSFRNCRTAINADENNSLVKLRNNDFLNCGTYVSFGGTTAPSAGMQIENNTFSISNTLINNSNVTDVFKLDISNNLFKFGDVSLTSGQLSLEQKFTIENTLFHKGRSSRKGIVYFSKNEQFVIAGFSTIASALSFAPSTGETIYVGPGTYGSSTITTITLNKSVKINGANIDVSYKSTRNVETNLLNHKFDILANNVEINGIKLTAPNLAGQTVFGGDNKTFNNLVVKNSIFEDINGMFLYYQGTGVRDGITFSACKVSGIGNGTDGKGTSSAFNPWTCKNVTINNCLIENVDYNGINLESVENATVTNNIIRNIGKSGIQLANSCKGIFVIKNNEFTQINCAYYGWGKINTRNNIVNPVAPRTVSGTSDPDWQFYYAGIKWFSSANPLVHIGSYTIEDNKFDNCWCGYQFARELPITGGPIISFKNNILQNNTHGDVMIYRSNSTNALYNLRENGIENASIKVFDWSKTVGNSVDTLEQWSGVFQRSSSNTIVLDKTSPAFVQVETGKLITLPNMSINNVLDKAVNGDVIEVAPGTYTGNVTVNKSVTLLGQNKSTTIIQPSSTTTATVQITDGASGTTIKNFTVKGKFATQTTTGAGDTNNNNSAILVLNTDTSTNPPINNLLLENLVLRQASSGIAFNNKHSTNITIKDCVIQNNEGSGVRVATNTETMNGFFVDGCTIQNNNLSAIESNASGTYRPNCTNFKISNCTIKDNNLLTRNNSHDVSIFGFNGNLEISNTNIECKHSESKSVNGTLSAPTSGGWGLIIFGTGNSIATYKSSGNITMTNVTMTGNVIKSVFGVDRYSTLGNISMNNVNIKDCQANKANQTWLQLAIGHRDTSNSFLLGNTKLKTIYTTNIGNIDATNAKFYDITTGSLLSVSDHLLQIKNQIYDKTLNTSIGEVIIANDVTIISPSVPNSIINSLDSKSNEIYIIPGTHQVDKVLVNKSTKVKIISAVGGPSIIRKRR